MKSKKNARRVLFAAALCAGSAVVEVWVFPEEAEAIVGRPATPVSYAGAARRTTRRVTPGVGAPGVGVF